MLKDDLIYFNKIMNIKSAKELYNNYFCWLYPFTNENIKGYYSKIDFKDKNILIVTSSGDHILNALLNDVKSIDAFDTNPLAKYYSELKIAAIKALSLEEFIIFFYNKNNLLVNKHYFSKEIYNKIKKHLKDDYKLFWDYVFENFDKKSIIKSHLFTDDFLDLKNLLRVNSYLNEDNYYKLREVLNKKNINYYDCSFQNIINLNKKYDVLILSNIAAFFENEYYKESLKEFKNIIDKISNEDAQVIVCYLYYNMLNNGVNQGIYNYDLVNKCFDEKNYNYVSFSSSENISKIFKEKEDMVLIKKKTN